jgi:hypothetical protein
MDRLQDCSRGEASAKLILLCLCVLLVITVLEWRARNQWFCGYPVSQRLSTFSVCLTMKGGG